MFEKLKFWYFRIFFKGDWRGKTGKEIAEDIAKMAEALPSKAQTVVMSKEVFDLLVKKAKRNV